jgi:hypothetical protein
LDEDLVPAPGPVVQHPWRNEVLEVGGLQERQHLGLAKDQRSGQRVGADLGEAERLAGGGQHSEDRLLHSSVRPDVEADQHVSAQRL